jgi:hypothetical protein
MSILILLIIGFSLIGVNKLIGIHIQSEFIKSEVQEELKIVK